MKWIQKGREPKSFPAWKAGANEDWSPSYSDLRQPEKPELHKALLAEQGYICCYCNGRIGAERGQSHIEHIKPQSYYPHLALNYQNLAASCQGENEYRKPVHCGNRKADWPAPPSEVLLISPLDEECEAAFEFTASGEIMPGAHFLRQNAAAETIERLGLNIPKLTASRSSALEGVIEGLPDYTEAEIQALISYYSNKDENRRHTPYCCAIVYLLRWSAGANSDDEPASGGPGTHVV